ncbi:glycosyltransferase involved in cell wall biosynthesis [Hymenobacter luteus]|uniref:Glycosyltransferase involved in cell wall biosynthesis n=2 Tax=Hymenobacter TaxID=89966 RepID=A0A7W9WBS5_9BACT|nr:MULTISPECIES: glycosyltransferase [Hymenobacter]MBB4602268.1 glycosyltransferase involved in cell wall biosynthesis [Hymenobacter latericoloratus]MBB6059303.1 glycosyltransferase involved in cell wall biosynthesis [Hymenobacter luteus]
MSAAAAHLPLVSIVALCHNHARFLETALDSILAQTYPNLEVILVDDASTDGSQAILRRYATAHPHWQLLLLPENVGNCRAFNLGFRQSKGEFIVDFATDDVLLPARLSRQVRQFEQVGPRCGMVYSDAELIDEAGRHVRNHFRPDARGQLQPRPASGLVFAEVLARYFISTPTMTMRRATLEELGGYDETLAYEDFDFWVRASRNWEFHLLPEVTTQKRLHPQSMSRKGYRPNDPYLASTIRVCRKALALCRTGAERAALARRVRWELRQAVRHRNRPEARELYRLLRELRAVGPLDWLLGLAC